MTMSVYIVCAMVSVWSLTVHISRRMI